MLRKMISKRYKTLEEIKLDIEKTTNKFVSAIAESQIEDSAGYDFMIDYAFENNDIYTMYYIYDNNSNYYITEV